MSCISRDHAPRSRIIHRQGYPQAEIRCHVSEHPVSFTWSLACFCHLIITLPHFPTIAMLHFTKAKARDTAHKNYMCLIPHPYAQCNHQPRLYNMKTGFSNEGYNTTIKNLAVGKHTRVMFQGFTGWSIAFLFWELHIYLD